MSNKVTLQFTKFQNINDKGNVVSETLGYRIYDEYDANYNNTFESLEELNDTINKDTINDYILNNHPDFYESVSDKGIYFNDEWIGADDSEED